MYSVAETAEPSTGQPSFAYLYMDPSAMVLICVTALVTQSLTRFLICAINKVQLVFTVMYYRQLR